MSSAAVIASCKMVRESRRIEPNRVASQGCEEQGILHTAECDHVDGSAEDFREIFAKPHVGAEDVVRMVGKIHENIDVAAARIEVIARGGPDQLEE